MAKRKTTKIIEKDWQTAYFTEMTYRNAPLLICKDLKIKYEHVKAERLHNDLFNVQEQEAIQMYHERLIDDLQTYLETTSNEVLRFKFVEKISKQMQNNTPLINIDNSSNTTNNLLQLDEAKIYSNTQKLLSKFTAKARRLSSTDSNKSLVDSSTIDVNVTSN